MLLQIMPDLVAVVNRVKGGLKGVTCVCACLGTGADGKWMKADDS